MQQDRNIQAVIFDMDGLLFDTERLFFDLSKEIGKEIGWKISDEILYLSMGKNHRDIEELLKKMLGKDFPFQKYVESWRKHRDLHFKTRGIPTKGGAGEILQALQKMNMPCALATSSRQETARYYLTEAGFLSYFAVVVGGDDVSRGKPEPDIFLRAASLLGVTPSSCMVFEDSENGIKAGLSAGMRVVHIPDLSLVAPEIKERVHRICDSLGEAVLILPDLLSSRCCPDRENSY